MAGWAARRDSGSGLRVRRAQRTSAGSSSPGRPRSSVTTRTSSPSPSMPTASAEGGGRLLFLARLIPPRSPLRSPGCSATAIRASASCSSRTSPASSSSAVPHCRVRRHVAPARLRPLHRGDDRDDPFRPSQAALTPTLARTPEELTAANAVCERHREHRLLRRPRTRGRAPRSASTGTVFLVTAALILVSSVFIVLIRTDTSEQPHREIAASTIAAERLAGFTTLTHHPSLRVMPGSSPPRR